MSILDKLPEHLALVAELKSNLPLCLLVGLEESQINLSTSPYIDDQDRIRRFVMGLESAETHYGDCVKMAITCSLCSVLDAYSEVEEHLSLFNSAEDKVAAMTQVMLGTESDVPSHHPYEKYNKEKMEKFFEYQCDMEKRIAVWAQRSEEEKQRVKKRGEEMMDYLKSCLEKA